MVVEHLDELRDRVGQIELGDNGDGFIFFSLKFIAHAGGFGFRAHEDEAAFELALGETAFERDPDQFLLRVDQPEADEAENQDGAARHDQILLKKECHQNQNNRRQRAALEQRPQNGVTRAKKGSVVKPLRFEQKGRGNHSHRNKKSFSI